jgi:hypothetical protein
MRWKDAVGTAALVVGLVAVRPVGAADVYRWTDERGVVHFSDVPPHHATQFSTQTMPDAPPPAPIEAVTPAEGAAAAAAPEADAQPTGPAKVVLLDKNAVAVGPSTQAIRGKVKNTGGVPAREVSIDIIVTEPIQGAECLRETIDVEPSTLEPGEVGSFEAEFDNPCFNGPTDARLHTDWR